jgi:hypothetical protein
MSEGVPNRMSSGMPGPMRGSVKEKESDSEMMVIYMVVVMVMVVNANAIVYAFVNVGVVVNGVVNVSMAEIELNVYSVT